MRNRHKPLNENELVSVSSGLVTSRLDYCNSLLYGTSKSNLNKLQRVQSDLARVVLQAAWRSSSGPLLKQLHWLPVQQRIIFKMALITFNVKSFKQPFYLYSLLDNYTPPRNLRSEGQHLLRIPLRKSAAARRSFCFGAPTVWNSLNSKTREADSLGSFKTRLKTELFSSAFQWSTCSSPLPLASESPLDNLFFVLGRNLASKSNSIIIIIIHQASTSSSDENELVTKSTHWSN